jgi:hypothetical protein
MFAPAATVGAAGLPGTPATADTEVGAALAAAMKVNEAVPVCVPWVTVTVQVPAALALSDVPLTVQASLDANVTVSVPAPPAYVSMIGMRTVPVTVAFDTLSATATGPSPRTTGAPASAALPPHPARSITAHAMTAPAAFPLPERGAKTLN